MQRVFLALGLVFALLAGAPTASFSQIPHQILFEGVTGQALMDSVRLHFKPSTVRNYNGARDYMYAVADNVDGLVECLYTGAVIPIDPDESTSRNQAHAQGFNAEHVYPQSRGAGSGNARSDLHHLFPVNANVNSSRGNDPFAYLVPAQVNTWWRNATSRTTIPPDSLEFYSRSGSTSFQPRDAVMGDVARAVTYFYTMYTNEAVTADPDFFPGMIATLLEFHRFDPVDQAEWDRTHRAAVIQDNLINPFILDTSLVARIFFTGDFEFPDLPPPPTEYLADFESGTSTLTAGSTGYAEGVYLLAGLRWQLGPEATIGSDAGDMRNGSRSLRLRRDADTYGSATMMEDKPAGLGTISFSYARSNFSGDRTGTAPRFVAEFSTDQGQSWLQLAPEIDLSGVDALTTTSVVLNNPQNGRVRFRQTGGDTGKRWNLDDVRITHFIRDNGPFITLSVAYLQDFTYVQGDGPSAAQSLTILAEELEPLSGELRIATSHAAFEVSLDGMVYNRVVALPYNGDLENVPLYIRLRAGLPSGAYQAALEVSGGDATPITVALSGTVSPGGRALTGIGEPYLESFQGFTSLLTLPEGWVLDDDYAYGGVFGSGTAGGLRGDGALGFQLTGSSPNNAFTATLTLLNDTGGTLSDLYVSYTGRVARTDQAGTPSWQVKINGNEITPLAYQTSTGADAEVGTVVSGLDIPHGDSFTLSWHTTSSGTSGTRRQIGISDVRIEARPATSATGYQTGLTGAPGYRMLASPVPVTLHQFLNENGIFTQCFEGATVTGPVCTGSVQSNVFLFHAGAWVVPSSASYVLQPGEGVLVYVFDGAGPEAAPNWPKPVHVSGPVHALPLHLPVATVAGQFSLVGNPSPSTLRSEGISRNGVSPVVYVWDVNAGGSGDWVTFNGFGGDLDQGLIAPFQGFLLYTEGLADEPEAVVGISSLETADTEIRGKSSGYSARLTLDSGTEQRSLWLTFGPGGELTGSRYDVPVLSPLGGGRLRAGLGVNPGETVWYSTRHLPVDADEYAMPMYITQLGQDGESAVPVTLALSAVQLPEGMALYLRDESTGQEVHLTASSIHLLEELPVEIAKPYAAAIPPVIISDAPVLTNRYSLVVRGTSSPVSTEQGVTIPVSTTLHPNYPNPFNPSTQIRFDISDGQQRVRLAVYDTMGREVRRLVDGDLPVGTHQITFDGSGLSSGIYLIQFQAGGGIQSRKMILLK